ncbi:MAG TPA: SGNH/GDSL hydrolase family protein [Albitalea sp.]|nr:SGNH/GDSL hydrolase family protein [Albitalea sp.]
MSKLDIFSPAQLFSSEPPDLSSPAYRFLAEGDSWFSIGTLNLLANSNLLFEMEFAQSGCAVNCASPGDTLKRMVQMNTDRNFIDLLCGRRARRWEALLMSCGGNDLIEAVGTPPVDAAGQPVPPALRLLLTRAEWGPPELGAQRYLSDAGWQTFRTYLGANFEHLIALRDRGPSAGQPIFVHGYAFPTPRPAGAGPHLGPWLLPALRRYEVPDGDGIVVAHELLSRLGVLLAGMAADAARFANLHFFDSSAIALEPALPGSEGMSGDWVNEIHLTRAGYRKIAVPWAARIEEVLAGG